MIAGNTPLLARARRSVALRRVLFWAVVFLVAVASVIAGWRVYAARAPLAPNFTLTDQDAHPFTLAQQRGRPVVLFFGYTHCPDVCPTTLARLARALRGSALERTVRVAFISVDPRRDSIAVMKRYVALFDPNFVGLTGQPDQLKQIESDYHTWSDEVPVHHRPHEAYIVAHGTTLYFIDRAGQVRGFGDWADSVDRLKHELTEYFG